MAEFGTLVRIADVHKFYSRGNERVDVLQGVNITIPKGEPSNTGSKDPRLTAWPRPNAQTWRGRREHYSRASRPRSKPGKFITALCVPRIRRGHGVRVSTTSQPGRPSRRTARRAAGSENTPKTTHPQPDMAETRAPACRQEPMNPATTGWRLTTGPWRSFTTRIRPLGQPG